jgi:hypothetical protein
MHAGRELLAPGSAHRNPPGSFPPGRYRVPWPARCCLVDPEVPAQVRTTRTAARIRAPGTGGTPLKVIRLFPSGPGSPGLR